MPAMTHQFASARLAPLLLVLIVLLAFAGCRDISTGVTAGADPPTDSGDLPPELHKLGEAYSILLNEHVDHETLNSDELSDGAIRGLLEALDDPHASYLTAEQYSREQEGYRGYFEGIGAQVSMTDDGLTVIAPIPGSPAEAAGIRPGDIILAVDGGSIDGLSLIESVNLIRGPGGSDVTLMVKRSDNAESVSITVTRGRIPIESAAFRMLDEGIGHLWIYSFSNTTEREVRTAIDRFNDAGGQSLVLDLRNNPGGLLDAVINVTGLFLDGGPIMYEIDAQGNRTNHQANSGGPALSIPMVVLVNKGSASASEILAGAIKTNGRALVIGETTFGKGSVNITRELSDGSAIYFSIRRWYLPDGAQIEGQGVTPDIEVQTDAKTLRIPLEDDVALRRAIEILQQRTEAR